MARHAWPTLAITGMITALLLSVAVPMARGAGGGRWTERELLHGVTHLTLDEDGHELMVHVARVAPDAAADLRVVSAHDQIAGGAEGGRELTSDLCRRAGGIVCVNGDFAECPSCGQPIGGLVRDGRVLRSFHSSHEQASILGSGAVSTGRLQWSGRLVATYSWPREATPEQAVLGEDAGHRTETRTLTLDALNRTRHDGATVLFTPEWAPSTGAAGGFEAVIATPEGVRPGSMPVAWRSAGGGDSPIPLDGVVVSASGGDEQELRAFWGDWHQSDAPTRSLVLETALDPGVLASIGGHPVLLRDGQRQPLDPGDRKVAVRHPRTLLGWTGDGELLLVTVDGRQRGHSEGMTLDEATDLMLGLGATHALNLDGGGSSTFVGPCGGESCVLNRPSDGRERHVTTALVLVPREGSVHAASTPAPTPAPAPPPPPPPAPAPAPLVVESTAVPVVEAEPAPAATEPAPTPEPAEVTPADPPSVTPEAAEEGERRRPARPTVEAAIPVHVTSPVADGPARTLTGLAVLAVLADVAAAGWLHRRRLRPVLADALRPRRGAA